MKLGITRHQLNELRNYIRNVLAPDEADREQLRFLGKRGWDEGVLAQEEEPEAEENELTIDRGPMDLGLGVSDPYVKQDSPAPTVTKMFGNTGP